MHLLMPEELVSLERVHLLTEIGGPHLAGGETVLEHIQQRLRFSPHNSHYSHLLRELHISRTGGVQLTF